MNDPEVMERIAAALEKIAYFLEFDNWCGGGHEKK